MRRDVADHHPVWPFDAHVEAAVLISPLQRQPLVRLNRAQRRAKVVVHPVTPLAIGLVAGAQAHHRPLGGETLPRPLPHDRIVAHRFCDYVTRPGQCSLDVRHLVVYIVAGNLAGVQPAILTQQELSQRLQPALARQGGPRMTFGLVRPVQVFDGLQAAGCFELAGQFWRQLALRLDLRPHTLFALGQLAQILQPFLHAADLHLIQAAGHFLTIAGNKGDRIAFVQQGDRGDHLAGRQSQLLGDRVGYGQSRQASLPSSADASGVAVVALILTRPGEPRKLPGVIGCHAHDSRGVLDVRPTLPFRAS